MAGLRVALGILAGDLLFAGLSVLTFHVLGQDPHEFATTKVIVGTAALGALFAVGGGYLAATIARQAPVLAGLGVAVLIALGAVTSVLVARPASIWSQVAAAVVMAPAAVGGSLLRSRTHPLT